MCLNTSKLKDTKKDNCCGGKNPNCRLKLIQQESNKEVKKNANIRFTRV